MVAAFVKITFHTHAVQFLDIVSGQTAYRYDNRKFPIVTALPFFKRITAKRCIALDCAKGAVREEIAFVAVGPYAGVHTAYAVEFEVVIQTVSGLGGKEEFDTTVLPDTLAVRRAVGKDSLFGDLVVEQDGIGSVSCGKAYIRLVRVGVRPVEGIKSMVWNPSRSKCPGNGSSIGDRFYPIDYQFIVHLWKRVLKIHTTDT